MDIKNNRSLRSRKIKNFTLNAIATTILALNAEVARAVSCPSQIVGTPLAGIVCDFDISTGSSITVTNAGSVGGIAMTSYNPTPPSQITINAGGVVNNLAGIGIAINSSTLSNGITNNGTINATSGSGILISNASTISGGISNTGTISISNVFVGLAITNNSTINGNITNSGLIEASGSGAGILVNGTSTINGGISNSGTIRSTNNSGVTIFNVSNVTGNISNTGIISGGNRGLTVHNAATVGGSIINSGTINGGTVGLSIFSATTISGNISNSGTIKSSETGIAVNSSSTISGGISNSGTIQGDIFGIRISPESVVNNIDILGTSARVIGTVDAPNTTVNITSGAVFTSEGSYNVDIFNIASNATFNMANTVTATTVNNSGTLAVGGTTQTIAGDYTQDTGGVFKLAASNTTNYGTLTVTGAVDLSASGNINVSVAQNALLHDGDILSNVLSGNTLISPTNGYFVTDDSFFWKFTASNNLSNSGINLTATIDSSVYNACRGDYCQSAANVIIGQVAAGNSAFNPYTTLTNNNELNSTASQATPELTNENAQLIQLTTRSVMDIVPMWGILHGKSAGDAMLYQPGKLWLKPYTASMIQDEMDTVPGYHASVYGIVIGKDKQLTENGLFGGAFAVGKDNLRGKAILSGQSIESDIYQAIVYGIRKFPHHIYLAGQGLLGYGNNDSNRSIPLYSSTAQGSYDSWFTNIRTQLGWNIYPMDQNLVLTPEIDGSYLFVNQRGYQETGSVMNLKIATSNNSFLVLGAYGNAAYRLANFTHQQDLTLSGYIGIASNVLNTQPQVTATFIAGGPSFSTTGTEFNKAVFRGGVGMTLGNPAKPLKLNLSYDIQNGNHAYNSIGSATITYRI